MSDNTAAPAASTGAPKAPTTSATPAPKSPTTTGTGAPAYPKISAMTFGRNHGGILDENGFPVKAEAVETTEAEPAPGEGQEQDFAPEAAEAAPETEAAPEPAPVEDVHGIPVPELLEALRNGQLPDALWDVLQMELKDGDDVEVAPLRGYRDSVMLHKNYTKKRMAEAAERKQLLAQVAEKEAKIKEFFDMVTGLRKDPARALRAFKTWEIPTDQIVEHWATEYQRRQAMTPEQRAAEDAFEARQQQVEKQERELRAREAKLQEQEGERTKAQVQKEADGYREYISQHMPAAFAAVGVDLKGDGSEQSQKIRALITKQFSRIMYDVYWPENTPPTEKMIRDAALATAELLGIRKPALAPKVEAAAKPAPAAKPATKPAAKPLAGAASYDPGKGATPARAKITPNTFGRQLGQVRRGGGR